MPDHELLLIFSKSALSLFGAGKQANPISRSPFVFLNASLSTTLQRSDPGWIRRSTANPGVKTMKLEKSGLTASGQTHAEKSEPLIIISKHLSGESDA
jgi:hypothetical protein